jgi:hypothetical protein
MGRAPAVASSGEVLKKRPRARQIRRAAATVAEETGQLRVEKPRLGRSSVMTARFGRFIGPPQPNSR